MFHLKQKLSRNPIRLLAVMLAMALVVTLTPYQAMTVQAEGTDLTTDGGSVKWDFTERNAPLYTTQSDGSLSVSGTFTDHGDQHGAIIGNDTIFSINVPAGQTTLELGICQYGSSKAKIQTADGTSIKEDISLGGRTTDTEVESVTFSLDYSETIQIIVTGNGYLHYITAETITPPQVATVSGTISSKSGSSVAGETLLFTDENEKVVETTIGEGNTYSVVLPIGEKYIVSFKNSDIYEVVNGNIIDLISNSDGDEISDMNIVYNVIWDTSKNFSFEIGGTTYSVTPGNSSSADFDVSATEGGSVELATTDTAIIWANLEGAGTGSLRSSSLENVSENVNYEISGNTINFTYKDSSTSPSGYTIQVKDNSASGTPLADGSSKKYDFRDGSVVSTLHTDKYAITKSQTVSSTDKLVTLTGNNKIQFHDKDHGITVSNDDEISVKVAGNAEIAFSLCSFSGEGGSLSASEGVTPTSVVTKASSDGDDQTFTYVGEGGTLTFTYQGEKTCYIHSITVTNEPEQTKVTEQTEMPETMKYGKPDNMTVKANGQQLSFEQSGGSLASDASLSEDISYYGFKATPDLNKLEADIVVESSESGSSHGVFVGVFSETSIVAAGLRNSTNLRGIYTDDDMIVHAGGINETVEAGQKIHFTVEKSTTSVRAATDEVTITVTPEGGETYAMTRKCESEVSFGLILAGASVTVTNMKYYSADNTILYNQNECYSPIGVAPVITAAYAESNATRDGIVVTWGCTVLASGDGRYVIRVKKDDGEWSDPIETKDTSYTYPVTEKGTYSFQVTGKLGNDGTLDWEKAPIATLKDFLPALETPVLTAEASANCINLSWTAVDEATYYEIYRYSSDEGAENAKLLYTEKSGKLAYVDSDVTAEVPYYYYIIAYKTAVDENDRDNSSNPSATVWDMPSAGHTGDYEYEDEAAVFDFTYQSPDTVYAENVFINGTINKAGVLRTYVNDEMVSEQNIAANGAFDLDLTVKPGRNTVELVFTDTNGKETRQAYSFVYLTNADMIVDASYTGEDGTPDANGVPTYSTVQAAVDAVPSGNAERKTIFIKNGNYEERLVVSSPYISLIGESRDGVTIHCYPADLYPDDKDYEAGEDMAKRCATYIQSSAEGFSAENLTFKNDYVYSTPDGKSNKSADALRCDADEATFVNVTISGVQDTLYMNSGRQYYYQCRIEGLIDFIYSGDDAKALFEDCDLVFVYEKTHPEGGYVCAPKTAADAPYGLIFKDCRITSEEGCEDGTFHLARPWGPNAKICWINCYMGSAINAKEPYADMSGNSFMNASFYEYGSYGPGYAVNANRRQLSPTQAEQLLASLGWNPSEIISSTGSAYVGDLVLGSAEKNPTIPTEPADPEDKPNTKPSGGGDTEDNPTEKPGDTTGGDTTDDPSGNGGSGSGTTDVNGNGGNGSGQTGTDQNGSDQKGTDAQKANGTGTEKESGAISTGDSSNIIIWFAAVLISGAAVVSVLLTRAGKKRK